MQHLIVCLLALAAISAAPGRRTFIGVITDDMCWKAGHARMGMGSNDAECTKACIEEHGAVFVLKSGPKVYTLADQKTPERFAAQKVKVIGILDARTSTIQAESITAVK